MRLIVMPVFLVMVVVAPIVAMNSPLMLAVFYWRKRLSRRRQRLTLATGFGLAAAYRMWNLWFVDLPTHVRPPIDYVWTTILPYAAGFAVAGWLLPSFFKRRRTLHLA